MIPLAVDAATAYQLPVQASDYAAGYDVLFGVLFWGSVFFFAVLIGPMTYFAIRYRRKDDTVPAKPTPHHLTHNTTLELFWIFVPLLLCVGIFGWGFLQYSDASVAPSNATVIRATGMINPSWKWDFEYPDGTVTSEVHVPVGRPVKFLITSKDTLHSLYVPAMRLKMDAVPGRYTSWWFTPREKGTYTIFCAEYCGDAHSTMRSKLVVESQEEYDAWFRENADPSQLPPAEWGEKIYAGKGACLACHSLDGSPRVGPTWKGLWGSEREMADGTKVTADENYILESIYEPEAKKVKGYENLVMNSYKGILDEREVGALIEFIKTID
jgi:cytochrome c oxidase subunit 2